MTVKKLNQKQSELLKQLAQQLRAHEFNKVCRVVELEHKITLAKN